MTSCLFLSDDAKKKLRDLSLELTFGDFVKYIKMLSKDREEMMRDYGRLYCLKLAQEYWRTNSRTQRYNCKRRLREVGRLYPRHSKHSRWVLENLMQIKEDVDDCATDNSCPLQITDMVQEMDEKRGQKQ